MTFAEPIRDAMLDSMRLIIERGEEPLQMVCYIAEDKPLCTVLWGYGDPARKPTVRAQLVDLGRCLGADTAVTVVDAWVGMHDAEEPGPFTPPRDDPAAVDCVMTSVWTREGWAGGSLHRYTIDDAGKVHWQEPMDISGHDYGGAEADAWKGLAGHPNRRGAQRAAQRAAFNASPAPLMVLPMCPEVGDLFKEVQR